MLRRKKPQNPAAGRRRAGRRQAVMKTTTRLSSRHEPWMTGRMITRLAMATASSGQRHDEYVPSVYVLVSVPYYGR